MSGPAIDLAGQLPPPRVVDGHVCGPCRDEITRSEIAADPYYQGDDEAMFGDGE